MSRTAVRWCTSRYERPVRGPRAPGSWWTPVTTCTGCTRGCDWTDARRFRVASVAPNRVIHRHCVVWRCVGACPRACGRCGHSAPDAHWASKCPRRGNWLFQGQPWPTSRVSSRRFPPNDAGRPVLPGHGRWVRGHVRSGSKASAFRPSIDQGKPVARRGRKARDLPAARSEPQRGRPAAGGSRNHQAQGYVP